MKAAKLLSLAFSLALAAGSARALVDVNAFGGYTTLNMADVNASLDSSAVFFGGKSTDSNSGYYVGANIGITTFPFLKIGPRFEYVQAAQEKIEFPSFTRTLDANLELYELGLSLDTSLPLTGLSVLGGVWGGYGSANSKYSSSTSSATMSGAGSGFVAEAAVELRYKLFLGLAIGLDLGYRMANITNMDVTSVSGGASASNIGKPMVFKKGSTDAANFDYSGLNLGGSLSWNF